jgi:DDE superfamily endonuclease
LERTAPTKLMIAGKPARIEFEYKRHGTLTLIGNFQVTTGELIASTMGPTRTEEDFASHIEQTLATDPGASLSVTAREGTTISAGAGQTEISGFR